MLVEYPFFIHELFIRRWMDGFIVVEGDRGVV